MRHRNCIVGMYLSMVIGSIGLAQSSNQAPLRDPQALSVLANAVNAAGGLSGLIAVTDYTASGHITMYWDQTLDGNVTVKGRLFDLRIDASVPNGTLSWLLLNKQGQEINLDGTTSPLLYQQTTSIDSFSLPWIQMAKALADATVNVSYLGSDVRAGRPVTGIRIRTLGLPSSTTDVRTKLQDKDFFFDSSTFQVVTVEDYSFPSGRITNGVRRQVLFSNYQQVNGISVPFAIADSIGNQLFTVMTFNQVSFNAGYTDTDFQP